MALPGYHPNCHYLHHQHHHRQQRHNLMNRLSVQKFFLVEPLKTLFEQFI
jgi:hypothetical protein